MSVINQMLNGLEQRGVQVAAEQVRPVREARAYHKSKIAVLVVLLVVLLASLAVSFKRDAPAPPSVVPVVAEVKPAPAKEQPKRLLQQISEPDRKKVTNDTHHVTPARAEPFTAKIAPHSQVAVQNVPLSVTLPSEPVKQVSQAQQADAQFRKAVAFMQQGRTSEATAGFEAALGLDAGHEAARQALVTMLLEGKKRLEAEQVLQDGLKNKPAHSGFAMLLARLQVERGEPDQAIATLEVTLPYAGQQADYQAFYAALLQRKSRHREAAEHYQIALKAVPDKAVWLMGYGISLQALARPVDAKEAYQRALDAKTLSPELQAFIQQKIKGL